MSTLEQRIATLRSIERRIAPDAAWVRATRNTLLMQVKNTLPTTEVTPRERLSEAVRHFVTSKMGAFVRKPMMAMFSLLLVATGGSVMSVSAAERSLPGDFLYGLKLATEQARLAWASSKNEKLKLKTEFTERRVEELKTVANVRKDQEGVQEVAEILKRDLNTIKDQLADVKRDGSSADAVEAAKLVDQRSLEMIKGMQETKSSLDPESKQKVTEAQNVAADAGVKAIELLVEKQQDASSTMPVADVAKAIELHANAVLSISDSTSSDTAAASSTVTKLVQTLTSSTASGATSTDAFPKIVDQMKDLTTQIFAEQKAQEQIDAGTASSNPAIVPAATSTSVSGSSTSGTSTTPITTPTTSPSTPPPKSS